MGQDSNQINKKYAKRLFVIYIVSVLISQILLIYFVGYQTLVSHSSKIFSGHYFFALISVIVFFIPLLFLTHHYANLGKIRWMAITTKLLLIHHVIWVILVLIKTIATIARIG